MTEAPRSVWLSRIGLALAIAIVVARALMTESMRDVDSAAANAPSAPGATTALILDWLSGVPAMLVLVRRLLDRSFTLRWSWAHAALAALGLWALVSVAWADDQFLALVSAPRILAAAMLFWAFAQLVRRWDHLRIIAGVLVGLLLANVAHAANFRFLDYPDNLDYWKTHKAEVMIDHGWRADDFAATRFEQKLLAGEVMGFNVSPNALGAIVVMMSVVAVGCAAQRIEDRDEPGWAGVLGITAAGSLFILYYTDSKAAEAALGIGLASLALWRLTRRWLASHRALVFSVGGASILLGVVFVIAVGLLGNGLPTASLNFRWRYWTGAWPLVLREPLRGVGWANFADHYLSTRLPQATEEINDPHDLFVKLCVELGFVGLTLGVAWMALWTWRITDLARPVPLTTAIDGGSRSSNTKPFPAMGLLAAGGLAFLLSSACAIDFFTVGGGAFILLELMKRGLFVGLVALGVGIVGTRSSKEPVVDDRPAPWIASAIFVGVAVLILQSAVDITFFQTGPLMLTTMAMGALVGVAQRDKPARRDSLSLIGLIVGCLLGLVMLVVIVIPVGIAEHRAAIARADAGDKRLDLAAREYGDAFESWLLVKNVDYAMSAARTYTMLAVEGDADHREANLAEASRWYDRAVDADPHSPLARLNRARWLAQRARPGDAASVDAALADFDASVANNPQDVELRIEYAGILERFGKRAEAAKQLSEALAINDKFDPKEPERIELQSPARLDELRTRLARLQR